MNNTLPTSRRAFSARTALAAAAVVLACGGCAFDQPFAGLGNILGAPAQAKTASNAQGSALEVVKRQVAEGADAKALGKALSELLGGEKATATDRLEAVRYLLDNGVGVNSAGFNPNEGATPLEEVLFNLSWNLWHCSDEETDCEGLRKEDSKVASLLVSRGANMNIQVTDSSGGGDTYLTALGTAAQCGSADLVQLMLEKGAIVNATDKQGQTPLQVAQEALNVAETEAQKSEYRKIISLLKSAGAGGKGKKASAKKRK